MRLRKLIGLVGGAAALRRLPDTRLRIAVVASNLARFDGISGGVQHTIRAVSSVPDWEVSVFSPTNEITEIPVHRVKSANELASHPAFREADVIIYHFGIYHDLFEV